MSRCRSQNLRVSDSTVRSDRAGPCDVAETGEGSPGVAPGQSERRARIVMLAYGCNPGWGSEPGVGWHRAVEVAKYCDVWVLCCDQDARDGVERHLEREGRILGVEFVFVPRRNWEIWMGRAPGLLYLSYYLWHRRAFRTARRLHQEIRFDLGHQSTFCGFREPGFLWKLGVPFVWGPVGGTQNYPWRFLTGAGLGPGIGEAVRSIVNTLQLKHGRRVRHATKRAAALLAANSTVQRDFRRAHGAQGERILDAGVTRLAAGDREEPWAARPIRLLWSGLFDSRKALHLLLQALARMPRDAEYELRVVGDGKCRRRWQRLARRLGVAPRITWTGWLPLHEAVRQYDWADLFVFTSLRDTLGSVVLEALAAGLPVVCLDHQGVADVVTAESGVKIPVTSPDRVISGLRDAIVELAQDQDMLRRLRIGARRRAADYLWERQGERVVDVYQRVLKGKRLQWGRRSAAAEASGLRDAATIQKSADPSLAGGVEQGGRKA